jgi:hypothetical protein
VMLVIHRVVVHVFEHRSAHQFDGWGPEHTDDPPRKSPSRHATAASSVKIDPGPLRPGEGVN